MTIYTELSQVQEEKLPDNQYYLYIIENEAFLKVGISHEVKQRFLSLSGSNTGGNKPIRYAVSEPTYLYSLEKNIHNHFHYARVKGTEWFDKQKNINFWVIKRYIESLFLQPEYAFCNNLRKEFVPQKTDIV